MGNALTLNEAAEASDTTVRIVNKLIGHGLLKATRIDPATVTVDSDDLVKALKTPRALAIVQSWPGDRVSPTMVSDMTVTQFAEKVHVSTRTAYEWARQGKIPVVGSVRQFGCSRRRWTALRMDDVKALRILVRIAEGLERIAAALETSPQDGETKCR
jgi:hypothetical protein